MKIIKVNPDLEPIRKCVLCDITSTSTACDTMFGLEYPLITLFVCDNCLQEIHEQLHILNRQIKKE